MIAAIPAVIGVKRTIALIIGGVTLLAFVALFAGFAWRGHRINVLEKALNIISIDLVAAKARSEAEVAKHAATKAAYRDAQAEAERMETERLARVTARQKEITDDVEKTYRARVADARAAYSRLRAQGQGGAGSGGASGGEPVSCVPDGAGRTNDPACPLSPDERLTAELQAIQIEGLQGFINRHATVPVN